LIYLANGFSPSMVRLPVDVEFTNVDVKEFCETIKHSVNSVGHAGTIDLINKLCGSDLKMNRISIHAEIGDEIYIVLLTIRLEEGKVLSSEEIQQMYKDGKVRLIKAKIYGAVLEELASCEGRCDEITYDGIANKAKTG